MIDGSILINNIGGLQDGLHFDFLLMGVLTSPFGKKLRRGGILIQRSNYKAEFDSNYGLDWL